MKKTLLLCMLLWAVGATDLFAQQTGACERPQARAYLNAGNVHAVLGQGGLPIQPAVRAYEVPKGGGAIGMSCLLTWVGGLVEGQPRVASHTELFAGPLDDQGNPPDDCTRYDRLYEITRADLVAYIETGVPTDNLRDWPWRLGAPVVDGDGIPDNYDLEAGDRPALTGDQMFWWVMNDAGGEHPQTKSAPLGMEVQAMAFAYTRPGSPISNATFFRYKFVYKGVSPLEDAYFSLYPEPDLGFRNDNFLGADTTLHLAYVYNADNYDGEIGTPHDNTYGDHPPALGFVFLPPPYNGPEDARPSQSNIDDDGFAGLTAFMAYPDRYSRAQEYYNLMRGLWADGQPITYGGDGRDPSNPTTTIFYPGDPVTGEFWSQRNMDGQGTLGPMAYAALISTGPFSMQPGNEHEVAFAVVWARGTDHLDSVTRLKKEVAGIHRYAQTFLSPDVLYGLNEIPRYQPPDPLGFAQNYPNPFSETTIIRYSLPKSMHVRLSVYDVLGRQVAVLVDQRQDGGVYETSFEARGLPRGVYFYRIALDHLSATRRMALVR